MCDFIKIYGWYDVSVKTIQFDFVQFDSPLSLSLSSLSFLSPDKKDTLLTRELKNRSRVGVTRGDLFRYKNSIQRDVH